MHAGIRTSVATGKTLVHPTSLFRIASVSKPITAVAVLRLVQDRQLDLSARLTDVLSLAPPPGQARDRTLSTVTVLNLLQHLGGWDRSSTFDPMYHDVEIADALDVPLPITKADIATFMTGQPLQYTPGTRYAYSNYGYNLLGQIIEVVTGMPYHHYVSRAVFHPLGVTKPVLGRTLRAHGFAGEVKYHTQWHGRSIADNCRTRVPICYGGFNMEHRDANGGWLASAVDLVRFASTFDRPATSPVLNPASVRRMFALPEIFPAAPTRPATRTTGAAGGFVTTEAALGTRGTPAAFPAPTRS
ncbi:MAG: serine hydrolase [Acidobacteria bacterium]|nr:serine hydrolase [Acidobacteriota bacterium]